MESKKRVVFRVDSSVARGTGHVMRCLTLADQLRDFGVEVSFICCILPGNITCLIEEKGYPVFKIMVSDVQNNLSWQVDVEQTQEALLNMAPFPVDSVIVDHYDLDIKWETKIRPYTNKIMAIDDLADRRHDCDILLDQNLSEDMELRYNQLVPPHCKKLLGPQFALLRQEFINVKKTLRQRNGIVKRILVFFGGSDSSNETMKALRAIELIKRYDILVDVVVGASNPHKKEVESLCNTIPNTTFHCQIDNMAELMAAADLAIGAGGSASWERCYLGLPGVILTTAENQVEATDALVKKEAIISLGPAEDVSTAQIADTVSTILGDLKLLERMRQCAENVVGTLSHTVAQVIIEVL
jgi:UDP-2,4-diacetamido-2,4,6-trideoxy-beta-L-altropyranose hydrolase